MVGVCSVDWGPTLWPPGTGSNRPTEVGGGFRMLTDARCFPCSMMQFFSFCSGILASPADFCSNVLLDAGVASLGLLQGIPGTLTPSAPR